MVMMRKGGMCDMYWVMPRDIAGSPVTVERGGSELVRHINTISVLKSSSMSLFSLIFGTVSPFSFWGVCRCGYILLSCVYGYGAKPYVPFVSNPPS